MVLRQHRSMSAPALDAPRKRARRRLGPHSREHQLLAGLDWRTREGKLLAASRDELTRHVGGNPNSVQKVLIERAARLTLYIEMMDRDALESGTMSERNSRQYLAWVNALRLCLREIGLDEAKPEMPVSLDQYLATKRAAR